MKIMKKHLDYEEFSMAFEVFFNLMSKEHPIILKRISISNSQERNFHENFVGNVRHVMPSRMSVFELSFWGEDIHIVRSMLSLCSLEFDEEEFDMCNQDYTLLTYRKFF